MACKRGAGYVTSGADIYAACLQFRGPDAKLERTPGHFLLANTILRCAHEGRRLEPNNDMNTGIAGMISMASIT